MTTGIMARSLVRLIDYFLLIINKNDMTFNSYKSIINHRSSSIFLSKIPSYLLLKSSNVVIIECCIRVVSNLAINFNCQVY